VEEHFMHRIEAIQKLLGIKDVVYELLDWIEHVTDEEFEAYCSLAEPLPEDLLQKIESFHHLSCDFNGHCTDVLQRLSLLCGAHGACSE
jgi:hypothetical protein